MDRLPITVLEATDTPAAAFAAALLGDFGADVFVVEPVGGSALRRLGSAAVREVWWPILARNKHSLALDLQNAAAQPLLAAAVRHADIIFVDDSEQGRAVHAMALRERVQAQVTRLFVPGADRPDLWSGSTRAEFSACASGLVALTGRRDGPPMQAEFPLADASSGLMAALLALSELRGARLRGEPAQPVNLGLHETLQRMNEWQLAVAAVQGHAEPRNGNRFPMNWTIANVYRTRDGRMVTVSAASPAVSHRLMTMVGGDALAGDPRFGKPEDRRTHMDALDAEIARWMGLHDAADVLRFAEANEVVIGVINDAADVLHDDHVAARGNVVRHVDGQGRMLPMPAPLPRIDTFPGAVRHLGPAPGGGSQALLAALGIDPGQAEALRVAGALWAREGVAAAGAGVRARPPREPSPAPGKLAGTVACARRPMQGLRVVEVGIVVAGPFAGSLLAELGAQVTKVEAPGGGDPMRQMGVRAQDMSLWWGVSARAKQCIALDLKLERDRQAFLDLVDGADVLVENNRPGALDRLGLDWPTLKARNPRLVMLSISGYGRSGPKARRPGFGRIAEAYSGVVPLTGAPDDLAMNFGVSIADTSSGLMGAFGIALALFRRDVCGGPGAWIDLALYESLFRMAECQMALCEQLGRAPMREGLNDPYGWGASGRRAGLVPMRSADAHWLMVDVRPLDEAAAVARLSSEIGRLAAAAGLAMLRVRGIEAVQVHDGATLAAEPYFLERGDVRRTTDARVGPLIVPGEMPKRANEPPLPLFRAEPR